MFSMDFFRRNLKPIMAALTLMAMITFVFDDAMRAGSTWLIPLVFTMLFGGAGFVWGTRRGKQNEDLVVGAVLGLVVGLVLITFGQRGGLEAERKVAGLGPRELGNLKQQRESANRIVSQLFQKSHPVPKEVADRGEFSIRFYQFQMNQSLQRLMFGFGRGNADQEAVFTHLLRQEARRLGITVSDEAVTDFIKMVTERKLSTQDFREVCADLRVSDLVIYDILREELEARMAAEMTFPRTAVTPEQRWQDFRRITVQHQIEAVTIPVEPFVAGIGEPSESQLRKFFEEHKEKYPGSKGEPGFRQPLKVRLAYLEADFETIEAELEKTKNPTDEEVAKYYEDNKDFYIEKPKPKEEPKSDDDKDKKEPDTEKKEGDPEKPADKKTDGEKPATEKSESDKPKPDSAERKPDEDKKPEAEKKSDSPKPEPKDKPDAKSDQPEKQDSSGAAGDDKVKEDKPVESAKPEEAKSTEKKAEDTKEPESKTPAAKPDEAKKTDESKKSDEKADDPLKLPATGENPEKRPEPKYQPLEEVQEKIREQLLRDRTLEEIQRRISTAIGQMRKIGAQTIGDKTAKEYRSPQQVADEVRELGKKLELKYVETGLLTGQELFDLDEKGIGRATDPQSGGGQGGRRSVIDHVFTTGDDNTHTPEIAQDPGTSNQFAYWVVERVAAHVPEFTEPGLKDQVLKAWKIHEAAPKAEARAKELAKLATEQKSSLKDVLVGQTVLGDTESAALTAISPDEFTLFSLDGGSAPQLNPLTMQQQRPQLTQIAGVDKVDFDVMKAIDRIAVGGTEAVPNADRSGYFVIHVAARKEISGEPDAPQRKDFMERWPHGMAAQDLASLTFTPLQQQWVETIERRYNVIWPVK